MGRLYFNKAMYGNYRSNCDGLILLWLGDWLHVLYLKVLTSNNASDSSYLHYITVIQCPPTTMD